MDEGLDTLTRWQGRSNFLTPKSTNAKHDHTAVFQELKQQGSRSLPVWGASSTALVSAMTDYVSDYEDMRQEKQQEVRIVHNERLLAARDCSLTTLIHKKVGPPAKKLKLAAATASSPSGAPAETSTVGKAKHWVINAQTLVREDTYVEALRRLTSAGLMKNGEFPSFASAQFKQSREEYHAKELAGEAKRTLGKYVYRSQQGVAWRRPI